MNNPFSYEPHPLCIEACRELQAELSQRNDWRDEIDRGKMFGVLIVEADNGKIGYLRAYSGQIGGRSDWEGFVPAVFDYLKPDGYFKKHEAEISELNQQIRQLEANETLKKAKSLIDDLQQKRQEVIANYQTKIKEAKEKRDARRQEALSAGKSLSQEEKEAMIKESQFMKAELKRLKKSINEKTALETEYEVYVKDLNRAKKLRKELSEALQQWLFAKFQMLNAEGESKDLLEIFKDEAIKIPPAGSGECCEPKLLQYAYQHGITNLLTQPDPTAADVKKQILKSGISNNLDILMAGPIPPNPAELVARKSLDQVIDILKETYDYVLIDSAPVGLVTDTLQIGRVANATVLLCRADYTPKEAFGYINDLAKEKKLPNMCVVINGIDMSKKKYGYYYGYGRYGKYGRYGRYGHKSGTYGSSYGNYTSSHYGDVNDTSVKQ